MRDCGEKLVPNTFLQRNYVNRFCQIDKDCQKEKERTVENEHMLMLGLTTLHEEK